jgi:ribonuclease HIII
MDVTTIVRRINMTDVQKAENALLNAGFRTVKAETTIRSRWRYVEGMKTSTVIIYQNGTVMIQGSDPEIAFSVLQASGVPLRDNRDNGMTAMF